jgi:glycosyltransferase involved in cell wall biosynthesis
MEAAPREREAAAEPVARAPARPCAEERVTRAHHPGPRGHRRWGIGLIGALLAGETLGLTGDVGADSTPNTPTRLAYLAWGPVVGRSREIAHALGGEARCFYPLGIMRRPLVPLRYAISAVQTVIYLLRARPRALIVTNPPIFAALVAYPYARLAKAPLILDSHPSSFRTHGPHSRVLPLHTWLARRSRRVLVTTDELAHQVLAWGGTPLVVHEAPPQRTIRPSPTRAGRPAVLILGSLSPDEAVDEVLGAAHLLPELDFAFTGDTRRCPRAVLGSAPRNVTFLGFLGTQEYAAALGRASVAVVLTTLLREAVPRSAYDAVYAGRPLVLSDSPVLRELFPFAVKVDNNQKSIAGGVREALACRDELERLADKARELQSRRWAEQLELLREAVSGS